MNIQTISMFCALLLCSCGMRNDTVNNNTVNTLYEKLQIQKQILNGKEVSSLKSILGDSIEKVCLLFFLACMVVVRLFVFETCRISTGSMEDTIMQGDRVMVSKLCYGGLMPRRMADIPIVNLLLWLRSFREKDMKRDWGYGRAPGYARVQWGDLVVFNEPGSGIAQMAKRCVALPGDTFLLQRGEIIINRQKIEMPPTVKKPVPEDSGAYIDFSDSRLGWTQNNYGPVVVPAKGDTVLLDSVNTRLYHHIMQFEEYRGLHPDVDKTDVNSYTFETDCYFMMGDHRNNSLDSRYWGAVPFEMVIGKVVLVYFSKDPEQKKIRWGRIGKRL